MFCTYITIYTGKKLPPFYIGSTSTQKIKNGYHGSIKSLKYKNIWKQELKDNNHLFKTVILTEHSDRKSALKEEYNIQKTFNVIKSPLFINMSLAAPSGYFGRDVSGINNPMYNKSKSSEWKKNQSEFMLKYNPMKGLKRPEHSKKMKEYFTGEKNPMYGVKQTLKICPHCKKESYSPCIYKYHFDKCKHKII